MAKKRDIEQRWGCTECDWNGADSELLVADNPFDADQLIHGCPDCKAVGSLESACDEPGCTRLSSCGFPTPAGYRRTCYDHSVFKNGASYHVPEVRK